MRDPEPARVALTNPRSGLRVPGATPRSESEIRECARAGTHREAPPEASRFPHVRAGVSAVHLETTAWVDTDSPDRLRRRSRIHGKAQLCSDNRTGSLVARSGC